MPWLRTAPASLFDSQARRAQEVREEASVALDEELAARASHLAAGDAAGLRARERGAASEDEEATPGLSKGHQIPDLAPDTATVSTVPTPGPRVQAPASDNAPVSVLINGRAWAGAATLPLRTAPGATGGAVEAVGCGHSVDRPASAPSLRISGRSGRPSSAPHSQYVPRGEGERCMPLCRLRSHCELNTPHDLPGTVCCLHLDSRWLRWRPDSGKASGLGRSIALASLGRGARLYSSYARPVAAA